MYGHIPKIENLANNFDKLTPRYFFYEREINKLLFSDKIYSKDVT